MRNICRLVVAAALAVATGCAHRPPMVVKPVAAPCQRVVPDRERGVTWVAPGDARDAERLSNGAGRSALCSSNRRQRHRSRRPSTAWLSSPGTSTWAEATSRMSSRGYDAENLRKAAPYQHFVLLLQEAHREGSDVPADVPARLAGAALNRRASTEQCAARHPQPSPAVSGFMFSTRPRCATARPPCPEDRGTAILSTLPLANLQVIELPFERQRRVALAATVGGETSSRDPLAAASGGRADGHLAGAYARRPVRCAAAAGGGAGRGARLSTLWK